METFSAFHVPYEGNHHTPIDSPYTVPVIHIFDIIQVSLNWTELDAKRWKYASAPLRHWLPHVLQIMPRNPKYDQFQPKGHHNEENPQSMTKMPGNP